MSFFLFTETGDKLLLENGSDALILEQEPVGCALAQETGDRLLLEDGSVLLLENCPGPTACALVQETGDFLVLEDGSGVLLLENCPDVTPPPPPVPPPPPSTGSGSGGSSFPTRKSASSDILVKQLLALKQLRERTHAPAQPPKPETVYRPPRRPQQQLLMLLPYFMEIMESWDHSPVVSNV